MCPLSPISSPLSSIRLAKKLFFSRAETGCSFPDGIVTDPFGPIKPALFRDARSPNEINPVLGLGTEQREYEPPSTPGLMNRFEVCLFALEPVSVLVDSRGFLVISTLNR